MDFSSSDFELFFFLGFGSLSSFDSTNINHISTPANNLQSISESFCGKLIHGYRQTLISVFGLVNARYQRVKNIVNLLSYIYDFSEKSPLRSGNAVDKV